MSDLEIWWQAYIAAIISDKMPHAAQIVADGALEHYRKKEDDLEGPFDE